MLYRGTRWVMRVSRLSHCRNEGATESFNDAFGEWDLTASPSRLSRWEYGSSGGTHRVLRAYEDGCGLPPYLLFALNDRQLRAEESRFSTTASIDATPLLDTEDIYKILDRAVSGGDLSGSDWYRLANFATSQDYFYLAPGNIAIVARRLIEELARSLGPAYVLRFEALHLLASQTRAKEALVGQLMEMFEDRSTGAIGDAVSLILRASPAVRDELVKRMRESDSPMIRQVFDWMGDILRDRKPEREPVANRKVVHSLGDRICRTLPKWAMAHVEADMTQPLVETAIGGRSRLKRHEASLLLMLADAQEPLTVVLLDLLDEQTDPMIRMRLANLLEYQVPGVHPQRLEAMALAEAVPETRRSLWGARGHVLAPIEVTDEIADGLTEPGTSFALCYALGISGSGTKELQARAETPDEVRRSLAWWSDRGAALLV